MIYSEDMIHFEEIGYRTFPICRWASEKRSNQVTNGVNGVHNTCARCSFCFAEPEVFAVLGVAVDGTHERAVIAVYAGIECRNEETYVELMWVRWRTYVEGRFEMERFEEGQMFRWTENMPF